MLIVRNTTTGARGMTVGRRKDGSRAVLYDGQNTIHWFPADMFASWFEVV